MAKGNGKRKASGEASGKLVPQPHGGALVPGAGGGRKNGLLGGRPPSAIREAARKSFAERIPILERIADSDDARDSDRISAVKALADAGGVDKLALTVDEQPEQVMTPERVAKMWEAIQRIRSVEDLERVLIGSVSEK